MKLLIKIYPDSNLSLEDFNNKISNKSKTKISFVNELNSIPRIPINDDGWDIIIPIYKPFIPVQDFDDKIGEIYKEKFPNIDGVLWLNDGEQKDICSIPVIGKNYYKEFGYIYNPSYEKYNFDKEFTDVLKLKEKYYFVEDILFEKKNIISDDDYIYNFRKKLNFCLTEIFLENNPLNFCLTEITLENKPLNLEKTSLNKFVDEIYVINLERRKDRLEHIRNQFEKLNINFKRFNAVDGKHEGITGAVGCLRSHLGVIRHAISKGHQRIAIFEDDVILCDDFSDRFEYYSKNVPNDWEVMYLGCGYIWGIKPTISVPPYIFSVHSCHGCFAMILDNKNGFFQKILNIATPEKKAIDNYYAENILPKAYIFEPFFVKTLNTISDISDRKDSFSYEGIDSSFKNVVELKVKKQTQSTKKPLITKTNKEICEDYQRTGNFQVVLNGKLIFDSVTSDKSNITFFDNYFQIYGKSFSYGGMIIKRI